MPSFQIKLEKQNMKPLEEIEASSYITSIYWDTSNLINVLLQISSRSNRVYKHSQESA